MKLNSDNIDIVICTRGRINNQLTLQELPDEVTKHIYLVCFPGEKIKLEKRWGSKVKYIIEHSTSCTNLSEIRQWCIDKFESDYILFVDDNIDFHIRTTPEKYKGKYNLYRIIDKHFTQKTIDKYHVEIFQWIINNIKEDECGMVSISQRSGNNRIKEDVVYNKRIFAIFAINKKILNKIPNRKISDIKLKQDMYINLHLLTNGYPNKVSYKYAFGKRAANQKGGCSIYRDLKTSNEYAYILQKKFPDFVKVRVKSVVSWKGDFAEKAYDVHILWGKAYEYGLWKRNGNKRKSLF